MMLPKLLKKLFHSALAVGTLAFMIQGASVTQANAQAGVFEVVHPDVEQGEIEIEILSGINPESVEDGEERSVHEIAVGFGVTENFKFTPAIEIANPQGGDAEIEAFEFESLLLLTRGVHHDEAELGDDDHGDFTLGLFAALEVPTEGGIDEGAIEFGPVIETEFGELEFVGNLFVEAPFVGGEDPGLSYATQLIAPISDGFGIGVENFGEFEGLFGERGEDTHFAGPALYWEAELDNGHVIEPRLAVLFGLNEETTDTIISFNVEYKIGK